MPDTGMTLAVISALGADPAAIKSSVDAWLEDHPEATTTVQDGAVSYAKLDNNLQGVADDVGDLKSAINGGLATASNTGYGAKYINYPITDGKTYVISNTGSGVIGSIKTQANGANVEDVVANLAVNKTIEWQASDDADRFYVYFNAASSVEIYTKDTLYGEVKEAEKDIATLESEQTQTSGAVTSLSDEMGNYLFDSKDGSGNAYLEYAIKAGATYHIRTGAGIFGWIRSATANNVAVETIYQNCPANSDFTWTATEDAPKIYLYYNAASSFSIVEDDSLRDADIVLSKKIDSSIKDQLTVTKASSGNSYYDYKFVKGNTYAICVHGAGTLGSTATATATPVIVDWIKQTPTAAGEMIVFTASDNAVKWYVNFNAASTVSVYNMGAALSGAALAALSCAKEYSPQATYALGAYCVYNYRLRKCTTAITTAEAWTEAHWAYVDAVTVAADKAKAEARAEVISTPNYETSATASGAYISEDMTIVGDELWLFTQSTSVGGTANGYISRLKLSDYSVMDGQMAHNLGHCGATDYDADNDRMVICGADNGGADTPYMYIYSGVSDWAELASVAYSDVTVDRIDLSALASAYGAVSYLAACWGSKILDGSKLLYVYGGGKWFLLLMGTGTNELEMGAYTAASEGRYNGTYKVLNYWKYETHVPWDAYDDVMQGAVMHEGYVYTSNGHRAITLRKWLFRDDHVAVCEQIRSPWIGADGEESLAQGQGLEFKDGKPIVAISTGYIATLI